MGKQVGSIPTQTKRKKEGIVAFWPPAVTRNGLVKGLATRDATRTPAVSTMLISMADVR